MNNLIKSVKNVCLCTVFNILLVSFILILSFYLIRRINKIDLKKNIETFRTTGFGGVCKPTIKNQINMNKLAGPLNSIANSLASIDAKLDFVNGFKTIKEGKGKLDKNAKVPRKSYPDRRNRYRFSRN